MLCAAMIKNSTETSQNLQVIARWDRYDKNQGLKFFIIKEKSPVAGAMNITIHFVENYKGVILTLIILEIEG